MDTTHEVLDQWQTIREAILDRSRLFPDSPYHYWGWAVLSALGFTLPQWGWALAQIWGVSFVWVSGIFFGLMILIGFGNTSWLVHRFLDRQSMVCTKELRLIRSFYFFGVLFGSIVTLLLARIHAYALVDGIWLFILGMGMMLEHALGKKLFGHYGRVLMGVGLGLLVMVPWVEEIPMVGEIVSLMCFSGAYLFFGIRVWREHV